MFGVTPDGYNLKTLGDINEESQTALNQVTDPATGERLQVNLSDPSNIVTQIVSIPNEQIANGFLIDEAAYNQFDPLKSVGDGLSGLVQLAGLDRLGATASRVILTFDTDPTTQGTMTTGAITTDTSVFNLVTDGSFSVQVDTLEAIEITGLSFDDVPDDDYDEIATIVQTGFQDYSGLSPEINAVINAVTVTAIVDGTDNKLLFTSPTQGDQSSVSALSAASSGTDISTSDYLNAQDGTADLVQGTGILYSFEALSVLVTDSDGINRWTNMNAFNTGGDGTVQEVFECTTLGNIPANIGTLTVFAQTATGLNSVTNNEVAQVGADVESDNDLRSRFLTSSAAPSIGLASSIPAALANVEGILFASIFNNRENTSITPKPNLPITSTVINPKTIAVVVLTEDTVTNSTIAEIILARKGLGSLMQGNLPNPIIIRDPSGTVTPIQFYRAKLIEIQVVLDITIDSGAGQFPAGSSVGGYEQGKEQIQQNIIDFAAQGAAGLDISTGFDNIGFPPGQDVLLTRLYTPINAVAGHTITSLQLRRLPTTEVPNPPALGANDIPLDFFEVAFFSPNSMTINVTPES